MANYVVISPDWGSNLACRVCLAVDRKLHFLHSDNLADCYAELTLMPVSVRDGMPQYVCSYCKALLLKAVHFQRKCKGVVNYLQTQLDLGNVTPDYLRNIDRRPFQLPYSESEMVIDEIPSAIASRDDVDKDMNIAKFLEEFKFEDNFNDNRVNQIKKEVETQNYEVDIEFVADDDFANDGNDANIKNESNESNSDKDNDNKLKLTKAKAKQAGVRKNKTKLEGVTKNKIKLEGVTKNKTKLVEATKNKAKLAGVTKNKTKTTKETHGRTMKDLAKEFSTRCKNNLVKTHYRHMFLNYIAKKYENYSKENASEQINVVTDKDVDLLDSDDENDEKINDNAELINKLAEDATETVETQIFYTYIRDVYLRKKGKYVFEKKEKVYFNVMDESCKKRLAGIAKEIDCELKTYSFEEQKEQQRLINERFANCPYKCAECYQGYVKEENYKNHMTRLHDPSRGAAKCPVCGTRCRDERRMHLHWLQHKYKLQCRQCGVINKNVSLARQHFEMHEGRQYVCKECGKIFDKQKTLMAHAQRSHAAVSCPICYQRLTSTHALAQHRTLMHIKTYPCETCTTVFNTEEALAAHIEKIPPDTICVALVACAACGANFNSESERNEHINKTKHWSRFRLYYPGKHEDNRPARASEEYVAKVQRAGGGMCEQCGLFCQNSFLLNAHMRIHTGEKPFKCEYCGKAFRLKLLLKYHIPTHTGERNYVCKTCGKTFKLAHALARHNKQVHLRIQPFRCHLCDRSFIQKQSREMHIKTKHLNVPWPKRVRNKRKQRQEE